MLKFVKMQGLGNDYVYVDARDLVIPSPEKLAVAISAPHFGCGSDGLILILRGEGADFRMRMFNNDGSESGMCGNGLRCVAKFCHDLGLTDKTVFTVQTGAGLKKVTLTLDGEGRTRLVRADMGRPVLNGRDIPSVAEGEIVLDHRLTVEGTEYSFTLVNMGNPHAICFVEDPAAAPVREHGPLIERHPDFPEKTNVEFVQVLSRDRIRLRVWERGTGETLACGTGACAAAVACALKGLTGRDVTVELPGGPLRVIWDEATDLVYQEGPAEFVYFGEWAGEL